MKDAEFAIDIKPGSKPQYKPPYPVPHKYMVELKRQLRMLLQRKMIVRDTRSEYQAPILFAKKGDGGLRMCIDYRGLNSVTQPLHYRLPTQEEIYTMIAGHRYFSAFDMRAGYHHMKLRDGDSKYTNFVTPFGNFRWNVMTFGFMNAPLAFQAAMDTIFGELDYVLVYLDDIFVMSNSEEEHLRHIRDVLKLLRKNGVKLKLSKCHFYKRRIKYLGHIIDEHGYQPTEKFKSKCLEFSTPTTVKELRRFLGLVNWLHQFIPNLAQMMVPLTRLLKKSTKWNWTQIHSKFFHRIQLAVRDARLLNHPDLEAPFFVQCDASDVAYGGMLFQYGNVAAKTDLRPISFMSKSFKNAENDWHSSEKECFAVVAACKKWYKYLTTAPFVCFSDHFNLQMLFNDAKEFQNARLNRWAAYLQNFRITVRHLKGDENIPSDYLSRDIAYDRIVGEDNDAVIQLYMLRSAAYRTEYYAHRPPALLFMQLRTETLLVTTRSMSGARKSRPNYADPTEAEIDNDDFDDHSDIEITTAVVEQSAVDDSDVDCASVDEQSSAHSSPAPPPSTHPFYDDIKVVDAQEADDPLSYVRDQIQWDDYIDLDIIKRAQASDPWCQGVLRYVRKPSLMAKNYSDRSAWPKGCKANLIHGYYSRKRGLLWFCKPRAWRNSRSNRKRSHRRHRSRLTVHDNDPRLVVPETLRDSAIAYFHDCAFVLHPGFRRIIEQLKARFYWPGMYRHTRQYLKFCSACTYGKNDRRRRATLMQLFPAYRPFEVLHIDLVDKPRTSTGFRYALTMIDRYSRYVQAVPLVCKEAPTVAAALINNWVFRFGVPLTILSDRGGEFRNELMFLIAEAFGFKKLQTCAWHPQSNGRIERWHRYLNERIIIYALEHKMDAEAVQWDELLPCILFSYNSAINRMTGYSPNEIIFGHSPRFPIDLALGLKESSEHASSKRIRSYMYRYHRYQQAMFGKIEPKSAAYDQQRKHDYDLRRTAVQYNAGDIVTMYTGCGKVGKHRKGTPPWKGLYRVLERIGENAYKIQDLEHDEHPTDTVNRDRLKLIRMRPTSGSRSSSQPSLSEVIDPDIDVNAIVDVDDVLDSSAPSALFML
ncbi:MAG: DDE-type integrase/transposase/recombinase [Fuerstiella sp.]|nr:DDE-type integrase/transposase/recombinase [Fuerstiella sp.]